MSIVEQYQYLLQYWNDEFKFEYHKECVDSLIRAHGMEPESTTVKQLIELSEKENQ